MSSHQPRLSVVIATRDDPARLLPWIAGLVGQADRDGAELIVVSCNPQLSVPTGVAVRHLPGAHLFECRAAGLAAAAGDIVAFTEDHCIVPDDWCARILRAFETRPDLVMLGGAVANGSNARIADRMSYWMTFAAY